MKTLHLYLVRQILVTVFMTVAVFTFVVLLFNVLKEILPLLVGGQAPVGLVLQAIGLLIPFACVYALPMGFITAALLVFGRFSADRELTAARASGISLLSLVTPILLLSLFFCGISAWFNMQLGPQSRVAYLGLKSQLSAQLMTIQLPEGEPIHDFPGYVFYVQKNRGGNLENVMVEWLKYNTFIHAPTGTYAADVTNKLLTLTLFDARSVMVTSNGTPVLSSYGTLRITNALDISTGRVRGKPNVSDMTFLQLREELREQERLTFNSAAATTPAEMRELRELSEQHSELVEQIRVAMHRQIAFSFACFGFTLVGIPLGIRVHRRETNVGIAIALGLVVVYYTFVIVGNSLSRHPEFAPHLIFWLPNFIFQAAGAVLLWRANKGI